MWLVNVGAGIWALLLVAVLVAAIKGAIDGRRAAERFEMLSRADG